VSDNYTFPHQRLDAYRIALDLAVASHAICQALPRGNANLADQLKRASQAIPLLVGEGANRRTTAQKRQRYTEAAGEAGEVACALELIHRLGLADVSAAWPLAQRVHAMTTRLSRR